jgi:ketosteroid isomerase-like protein
MSEQQVQLARRGFVLWTLASVSDDLAGAQSALRELGEMYDDDVEIDCSRTLPDFPAVRGREAMLAWVEGSRSVFSSVRYEPTDFIEAGEEVLVVALRVTGQAAISGIPMEADFAYVFRYRDALVVSATTYATLPEALHAVGLA